MQFAQLRLKPLVDSSPSPCRCHARWAPLLIVGVRVSVALLNRFGRSITRFVAGLMGADAADDITWGQAWRLRFCVHFMPLERLKGRRGVRGRRALSSCAAHCARRGSWHGAPSLLLWANRPAGWCGALQCGEVAQSLCSSSSSSTSSYASASQPYPRGSRPPSTRPERAARVDGAERCAALLRRTAAPLRRSVIAWICRALPACAIIRTVGPG